MATLNPSLMATLTLTPTLMTIPTSPLIGTLTLTATTTAAVMVQASDYAIGQFRFLAPLLLVHGRPNPNPSS